MWSMVHHNPIGRRDVGHPRKRQALWRQNRLNVWPLKGRRWLSVLHQWKFNISWWKRSTHTWYQWNGHGYGAMLLIMAGEMPATSRQPDTQARELWMKWSIIQTPSAERTHTSNWMTLPTSWTFHWVVCRALSTSSSIAENSKNTGYRSTFLFITKLVVQGSLIWHITLSRKSSSCSALCHWMKHGFIAQHLKPKKASMMWKHPSHHTAKAFKEMPSVKNTVTLFWDHRGTLLVNFLHHGNTLTVEYYCDTLKKSEQAICCKMSGLSCQGVIRPTSQPDLWLLWCCSWDIIGNLPVVLISCTLISISLESSRSTWLTCDMQHILTSSKLWPSG